CSRPASTATRDFLAESVERAWTLIDVQLQRRHDLIPALARTVAAHAEHEREVLERVAQARASALDGESAAQLSREAGAQTAQLKQILGVAEAHPQLGADASFLGLQRALSDTEGRIAGSRTFYNDTLLLLRNRTQSFPGVLVARRLGIADHELL